MGFIFRNCSYLDCAIIKDSKPLESPFLVQVVQHFIGSDIQFDGKITLKNSSEPSDMECYSDSELDQDSEVEISIDNSSEVIEPLQIHFNKYALFRLKPLF